MRADTLVTHEAPESHPQGWRALGELAGTDDQDGTIISQGLTRGLQ